MPLDREHGEVFDGLSAGPHVVIAARHLAALSNYRTEFIPPNAKFVTASMKKPSRPVYADAVAKAAEAFKAKGAMVPIRFDDEDVLVQVYPKDGMLAVTFQRSIAGVVHYTTPLAYPLPPPVLEALLAAAGKRVPAEH